MRSLLSAICIYSFVRSLRCGIVPLCTACLDKARAATFATEHLQLLCIYRQHSGGRRVICAALQQQRSAYLAGHAELLAAKIAHPACLGVH